MTLSNFKWERIGGHGGVRTWLGVGVDGEDIMAVDEQPPEVLQAVLELNRIKRSTPQNPNTHWRQTASIPIVTLMRWRQEWQTKGFDQDVDFLQFVLTKVNDPEFKNLRTVDHKLSTGKQRSLGLAAAIARHT